MNVRMQRNIFLTTCLLESIEDENYRNTKKLLTEHHADPNLVIPDNSIAPIHYAAGMENTDFAEAAMKLILKCNGNPNVKTVDGETPLHIAVIWNRTLIVKMLLDHGADITIKDNDDNTPINYAINEKHFNLLPIFQNHAFEMKIQKRTDVGTPTIKTPKSSNDKTPKSGMSDLCKRLKKLDLPKTPENVNVLTPNQTNFNLKTASPFLVDIKCRRPGYKPTGAMPKEDRPAKKKLSMNSKSKEEEKSAPESEVIVISSESDDDASEVVVKRNLFELTEENLEKHLSMTPKKNRISLVNSWRDKVNKSRQRKSILPINEQDIDSFITKHTAHSESTTLFSKTDSVETVKAAVPQTKQKVEKTEKDRDLRKQFSPVSGTNDSFFTADEQHGQLISVQKDLGLECNQNSAAMNEKCLTDAEIIFQTQEKYQHIDAETGLVFYEQKLLAKPTNLPAAIPSEKEDADVMNETTETATATGTALPTDYDTDDLRKELKFFGDAPGPITKNTKRLYLKRLVRYKRKTNGTTKLNNDKTITFSIELQKTMRNSTESLDFIYGYAPLERQMIDSFQSSKKFREGNLKTSFIYLLIDPRILENLLAEISFMSKTDAWRRFIHAIFYVGKGKSSRPYAHLYDAIKLYNRSGKVVELAAKYQDSLKLDRIIDIWCSGKGVICLPIFHNITPAEAYTREAAIIDCLGVENLTNLKRGDYYGITKTWSTRDRKKLGVLLLYKAMHVFMVEGESQLRPDDIKKH